MLSLLKTKKNQFIILFIILFSFLGLASCNQNADTKVEDITVKDAIGRDVAVKTGSYERVVCIGAGALRLYSYVGNVDKLAGVEDIDNLSLDKRPTLFDGVARPYVVANEEKFKKLSSCGVGGPQNQIAEAEKILNCNPDIIVSEYEDTDKANKLSDDLNVPVVVISYGSAGVFDAKLKNSLELLGKVFNRNEQAKKVNDFIASEKAEIERRTKNIVVADQKKVYVMGLGNWGTTNHLQTAQNYAPFNVAHINNVVSKLAKDGIQGIEAEKFEKLAPSMDVMIMDAAAVKNIKTLFKENPQMFDDCKAWNDGEVYLQLAYNAYYTNVEIALCNTWWSGKVVYPSLFSDIDINAKLNQITKVFLGEELASKINAYPMSYSGYSKVNKETIFN